MIALVQQEPRFQIGQLVRHVRYGYRGVVVAFDHFCHAPDEWYYSNQTQPERNQPWYHVLVHDSESVTYAAESSLQLDETAQPINHPWVDEFFSSFEAGQHIRNERPFPP